MNNAACRNNVKQLFLNKCTNVDGTLESYIATVNVINEFTLLPVMTLLCD